MKSFKDYVNSLDSEYLQMLHDDGVHLFEAYQRYVKAWQQLTDKYGEIKNVNT